MFSKFLTQSGRLRGLGFLPLSNMRTYEGSVAYVYKACNEFLTAPLEYVFNLVTESSEIPQNWAVSAATPMLKIANTNDITNFSPINNTPVLNKIFEKIISMII